MSPGGRETLKKTLHGDSMDTFSARSARNRLPCGLEAGFGTDATTVVSGR